MIGKASRGEFTLGADREAAECSLYTAVYSSKEHYYSEPHLLSVNLSSLLDFLDDHVGKARIGPKE